jgi:hypothetical protein
MLGIFCWAEVSISGVLTAVWDPSFRALKFSAGLPDPGTREWDQSASHPLEALFFESLEILLSGRGVGDDYTIKYNYTVIPHLSQFAGRG